MVNVVIPSLVALVASGVRNALATQVFVLNTLGFGGRSSGVVYGGQACIDSYEIRRLEAAYPLQVLPPGNSVVWNPFRSPSCAISNMNLFQITRVRHHLPLLWSHDGQPRVVASCNGGCLVGPSFAPRERHASSMVGQLVPGVADGLWEIRPGIDSTVPSKPKATSKG